MLQTQREVTSRVKHELLLCFRVKISKPFARCSVLSVTSNAQAASSEIASLQ